MYSTVLFFIFKLIILWWRSGPKVVQKEQMTTPHGSLVMAKLTQLLFLILQYTTQTHCVGSVIEVIIFT